MKKILHLLLVLLMIMMFSCTQSRGESKKVPSALLSVGGRIYLDAGDNGATYTFYDKDGKIIDNIDLSNKVDILSEGLLDGAVWYSVENRSDEAPDRFYVANTHMGNIEDAVNCTWTYYDGSDWKYESIVDTRKDQDIGAGKENTDIMMKKDGGAYIRGKNENDGISPTVWYELQRLRDDPDRNEGYTDWFIPSYGELNALGKLVHGSTGLKSADVWANLNAYFTRSSSPVGVWSSSGSGTDSSYAWYWYGDCRIYGETGYMNYNIKFTDRYCMFAVRSF
ncbi:MAG: hypothetical protein MJ215_04295 [Spirochaetia bacterium]|nr:hypothetical protein [Spirochaetia bacterium]